MNRLLRWVVWEPLSGDALIPGKPSLRIRHVEVAILIRTPDQLRIMRRRSACPRTPLVANTVSLDLVARPRILRRPDVSTSEVDNPACRTRHRRRHLPDTTGELVECLCGNEDLFRVILSAEGRLLP